MGLCRERTTRAIANIGYWSATADYNYAVIESRRQSVLPVWEGLYLSLQPADSYTTDLSRAPCPTATVVMDIPFDATTALFGNATMPMLTLKL